MKSEKLQVPETKGEWDSLVARYVAEKGDATKSKTAPRKDDTSALSRFKVLWKHLYNAREQEMSQSSQPSQPSQPKAKISASSKPEASKADIDRLLANAETLAWPAFWEVLSQFQEMQDSEAKVAEYKGKLYNEDAMKAVEKGLNVILRKKHK